jgi:hypothetical protein
MADPISKLENDLRRAFARLISDRAVRLVCTIWHFLALLQHFFKHLYTREQGPFSGSRIRANTSSSQPRTHPPRLGR